MSRTILFASLLLLPLLPPAAPLAPCPNDIPHEPILVYEVTGFTLVGPFDRELILYQDSSARLSSTSDGPDGKSRSAFVTEQQASDLLATLSQDNAFFLCDQAGTFNDVPLSTLTVMRPKTDTRAHTFSWWTGENEYAPVEQALNQFIASAFPGF